MDGNDLRYCSRALFRYVVIYVCLCIYVHTALYYLHAAVRFGFLFWVCCICCERTNDRTLIAERMAGIISEYHRNT